MKKLMIFFMTASMIFSLTSGNAYAKHKLKAVTNVDVSHANGKKASAFEYTLNKKKHKIILKRFKGKGKTLHLYHKYKVKGKKYTASYKHLIFHLGSVRTVIFHKGVKKIPTALFNCSHVRKVYFPKTMKKVYDYSLSYLDHDNGKKVKIYYAGSQKKWHKIFKEYHRKSFKEAKGAAAKGTALADKLNEMIGSSYKKSHFIYYFHASISDVA